MTLSELKAATNNGLTILGNIPPRDILAAGSPEAVFKSVKDMIAGVADKSKLIASCGGGMPPSVSNANINAFIRAVKNS
jgi:uroporphyrinogen decarboxylase